MDTAQLGATTVADHHLLATVVTLGLLLFLAFCIFYEARIYRIERRYAVNRVPVSSAEIPQIILNQRSLLSANNAACELLDIPPECYPQTLDALFGEHCLRRLNQFTQVHKDFSLQLNNRRNQRLHLQAYAFGEGNSACFHARLLDVAASDNNPFYNRILDNLESLTTPALIIDSGLNIVAGNRKYEALSGYRLDELIDQPVSILRSRLFTREYYQSIWSQVSAAGYWAGQHWTRHRDGKNYLQQVTISSVLNEHGQTTHYLLVIAPAKSSEHPAKLAPAKQSEALASLPQHEEAQRYFETLTASSDMILIDICRYQLMRDTFGTATATNLLGQYIERLQHLLRAENYLAQVGKDEFLIMTPHSDRAYSTGLAKKILEMGRTPLQCDGLDMLVPANIGIAYYPEHGQDMDSLLSAASTALFAARTRGDNQYDVYHAKLRSKMQQRMRLESKLRTALSNNQLSLHYQPILNRQLELEKVEALLRWNDPEQGPISPALFIPVAEQSDLIFTIGEWVLNEACRQHAEWRDQGLGEIKIAVNLSSQQLKQDNLATVIETAINRHQVAHRFIELEITETTLMEQLDRGKSLLRNLKEMGHSLALDDFGTGYSSLAYLSEFPLDTLKVDRTFVQNIDKTEQALILDTIIGLAKNLTLRIVAEGVETEAQHNYLRDKQCDLYQGFLYARPTAPDELAGQLRNQSLALSEQPA